MMKLRNKPHNVLFQVKPEVFDETEIDAIRTQTLIAITTRPLTRAVARVIPIKVISVDMYVNSLVEWK